MAYLARPKRAAEDYARTHHEDVEYGQASKKPRFDLRNPSALAPDAPEDDVTLDADVIGSRGQQVRRNAVNIDGYDSDSEIGESEGHAAAEARRRKKKDKSKDEEAGDMFADLEDDFRDGDDSEGDLAQKGPAKKAVRFLDGDEIEGQVFNSRSGGHVSANFKSDASANGVANGLDKVSTETRDIESSSESEVDDEIRADTGGQVDEELGAGAKKTHAPKLDAFNMRNEQEDGKFDDQGNYVRKAVDPDAIHDSWLEGVSKKDVRRAKEAADKREEDRRRADIQKDSVPSSEALKRLIPLLEKGETVLEALARFGRQKERKPRWQAKSKNKKRPGSEADADMANEDIAEARRKAAVEAITESADLLLGRDQPELYDAERELLVRQYRRETGEDWVDPLPEEPVESHTDSGQTMWEYRWSDSRDGGEIHGPYEAYMMLQWSNAGYFGDGVEYRRAGGQEGWSRALDFP